MMRRSIAIVALAALLADPAFGQDARDLQHDAAIGRLDSAGYRTVRHCTVTAVAPRIALTAAHCVDSVAAGELHVLLGYDRGEWRRHFGVASVHTDPDGADIAVLCLDGTAGRTFPVAPAPAAAARLEVAGYGIPRQHVLSRTACTVLGRTERGLTLDCAVSPGASGAPVLDAGADAMPLVAVVSASNDARTLAAIPPEAPDPGLCIEDRE